MIGFKVDFISNKEHAINTGKVVNKVPYAPEAKGNHMGVLANGRSGTGIPITEYKFENGLTYYEMFPKGR